MENSENERRVQLRFVTKDEECAVPDVPLDVSVTSDSGQLNRIVVALLKESKFTDDGDSEKNYDHLEFDFLINGQLLRETIAEHFESSQDAGIFEKVVDVEYIPKCQAPAPHDSLSHDDWVSCVCNNGRFILAGCYDAIVHIWEVKKDASVQHRIALPGHNAPVKAVRWIDKASYPDQGSDEYVFVSTSHDESGIVWKWNSKTNAVQCLYVLRGHTRSVDCVDVANDMLITGGFDNMIKVWNLVDGSDEDSEEEDEEPSGSASKKMKKEERKIRPPTMTLSGHTEGITGIRWVPSTQADEEGIGKIVSCSRDNTMRIWDLEVAQVVQTLPSSKPFLSLAHSKFNGLFITGSCDRHVRLWDPRSNEGSLVKQVFTSHHGWVSSVNFSPSNEHHFISGSYDFVSKLWDIRSNRAPLYDLLGHEDKVLCTDWSESSLMLSGAADNQLKLFKAH